MDSRTLGGSFDNVRNTAKGHKGEELVESHVSTHPERIQHIEEAERSW